MSIPSHTHYECEMFQIWNSFVHTECAPLLNACQIRTNDVWNKQTNKQTSKYIEDEISHTKSECESDRTLERSESAWIRVTWYFVRNDNIFSYFNLNWIQNHKFKRGKYISRTCMNKFRLKFILCQSKRIIPCKALKIKHWFSIAKISLGLWFIFLFLCTSHDFIKNLNSFNFYLSYFFLHRNLSEKWREKNLCESTRNRITHTYVCVA